jgi:cytochrome c556
MEPALKLRTLLAATALAALATGAQADVIAERKSVMEGVGDATRTGTQMVRGQAPFDLDTARNVLATYVNAAQVMPTLFPEGTETGGETSAAPSIWQDRAGFEQRFEKFGADAAAVAGSVQDLESFTAAFGTATQNCRGCHEEYRVRTN